MYFIHKHIDIIINFELHLLFENGVIALASTAPRTWFLLQRPHEKDINVMESKYQIHKWEVANNNSSESRYHPWS